MDQDLMKTCEYLTRSPHHAKLEPCGQPATHVGVKPPKRHYCPAHNALVSRPGGIQTQPLSPK